MKKNLIKILALSAIALSMSGCFGQRSSGGSSSEGSEPTSESETQSSASESETESLEPVAEEITLDEIFEYDTIEKEFVKAGQLVTLKQLCVYARYGNTIIVGVPYVAGGSILSLHGIEVNLPAQPDWQGVTKGRYANVDVEGIVANVNGRPVLNDAKVTINAEAQYDEETGARIEDDGAFSAAYWSPSVTIRDYWDQYLGRSMSGVLMEGIFQFASAPQTITTETSTDFKVVFPGENTDGEDSDNEYLINVHVPAGLDQATVDTYNATFVGHVAGDFIDMMAMSRFDISKRGMGFVLDDYWLKFAQEPDPETLPVILTSWSQIDAQFSPKFKTALPDLSSGEEKGVFSYTITNNFGVSVKEAEIFDDDTLEALQIDPTEAASIIVNMNCGSAKTKTVLENALEVLETAGWVIDDELSDDSAKDYYYVLSVADTPVAEINIWAQSGAKSVSMIFMAYRATNEEVDSLAAAIAKVQTRAGALLGEEYESALPEIPAEAELPVESVLVDWRSEEDVEGLPQYTLVPTFSEGAFADVDAWLSYADSAEALFKAAGFVEDYEMPIAQLNGLYNETSGEFVSIQLDAEYDDEDNITAVNGIAFVVVVDLGGNYTYSVAADHAWTVTEALNYMYDSLTTAFGKEPQVVGNDPWDLYVGGYYDSSLSAVANFILNYCMPSCATFVGQESTPNAKDATLTDYTFTFSLPAEGEGNLILIKLFVEAIPGESQGAHYFDIIIVESTAS